MHKRPICKWIFSGYILWMGWLLFGQRLGSPPPMEGYNLIPFSTIASQLALLTRGGSLRTFALINLVGNVILFVPAGYLIPLLFPRFRRFPPFLSVLFLSLFAIEGIQLVTGLGAFDVDDILLNLLGALMGYLLFRGFPQYLLQRSKNHEGC
ncbi:MAG: VanZ family protein [Clostridia bacterium]|nr:VanZ family protein [Clostridia bacterium]